LIPVSPFSPGGHAADQQHKFVIVSEICENISNSSSGTKDVKQQGGKPNA
jgi:hypothetical protein